MLRQITSVIQKIFRRQRLFSLVLSYVSYNLSLLLHKPIVWGYPPSVMIEPTNYCNLRCPLCPSGNQTLSRSRGYMDPILFRKVVNEIASFSTFLILWNQGEPFLHPHFLEMIRYAADKHLYTVVSTNANMEMDADTIVKSGLEMVIVSLDGATQETYNQYRINGNIEKVWENVNRLVEAKKRLGSATPMIIWQFLILKHNEHEVDQIKHLAKDLKVDHLVFKTAQIYDKSDIEEFLPINPKYRRYKIKEGQFELKFGIRNRCRRLWTQPVINWDGDVGVCCYDKDVEHKVGSMQNESFASLWKNDKFMTFRKRVLKDRKSIFICKNCGEGIKLNVKE